MLPSARAPVLAKRLAPKSCFRDFPDYLRKTPESGADQVKNSKRKVTQQPDPQLIIAR
jgi:hypothetical protein